MGGAGWSQETEPEGLRIPLEPRAGTGSLRQSPARAGWRAGEGTGRKWGGCGIQFGPRERQGWELIARTPVPGQAPGHTVKLTQMQTVAMSDQI